MFQGEFLPNLVLFLVGQVVAWGYLRTGLVTRGLVLLIGGWVFADIALVARFAYEHDGTVYVASLAAMQLLAVFETWRFVAGQVRRRRAAIRAARAAASRAAFVAYLKGDLEQAISGYGALVRRDPWDITSRIALGRALIRSGQVGRGRRALRAARRLDRDSRYVDLIDAILRPEPAKPVAETRDAAVSAAQQPA